MPKPISFWDHPIETLEEALSIRKQIAALEQKLGSLFGGVFSSEEPKKEGRGRRKMSASARAKIAASQTAGWAKSKETTDTAPAIKKGKKKGVFAAGRARIAAAQRARWAKSKGAIISSAECRQISPIDF